MGASLEEALGRVTRCPSGTQDEGGLGRPRPPSREASCVISQGSGDLTPLNPLCLMCNVFAQSLQSRLTLGDPTDCSPPGSSVHGIFQARILEWVALPSSRGLSQPRDRAHDSYVSCIGRPLPFHSRHSGRGMLLVWHSVTPGLCDAVDIGLHLVSSCSL